VMFNIYRSLLCYLRDFLSDSEIFLQTNKIFYLADPKYSFQDHTRVGGTFRHVKEEHQIPSSEIPGNYDQNLELFQCVMLLSASGVGKQLQRAGARLSALVETGKQINSTEEEVNSLKSILLTKQASQARICYWDQVFFLHEEVLADIWRLTAQTATLIDQAHTQALPIFQYLPEFYFEVVCDSFFFVTNCTNPKFEFTAEDKREKLQILLSVLVRNIHNPKIVTVDINDKILVLLSNLLQSRSFVEVLATNEVAKTTLMASLVDAFSVGHFWLFVSDIFVIFWRGTLFGKRKPSKDCFVTFQESFKKLASSEPEKLTIFLNKLFTHLNSVVTEFRVAMEELSKMSIIENENVKKKSALMFDLTCKLLKILEIFSLSCPEIFFSNELNMVRLCELILGSISTISTTGSYRKLFDNFLRKVTKSGLNGAKHFEYGIYGPTAGICATLFEYQDKQPTIVDTFANVDGSDDTKLFESLADFTWADAKQTTEEGISFDLPRLQKFMDSLREKYDARVTAMDEDEDEDNLCSICYSNKLDTTFVPCGHRSCKQCISRHLLEHKNCFFCNAIVESTETTETE